MSERGSVPLTDRQELSAYDKTTGRNGKELMKESGIARTFNQLFFIISSLLTFFHFLLYLSKIITKDN